MKNTKEHPTASLLTVRLSGAENLVLASLMGQPVLKLLAPWLDVCRLWYGAPSFSMRVGGEFISIESDWRDTAQEGLDYHVLAVSAGQEPLNISRSVNEEGHAIFRPPVSTVQIGAPRSPIRAVSVLERETPGRLEAVRYDAGLLFVLEDGRRFVLAARQSIQGGLECATVDQAIDELLAEVTIRGTIREPPDGLTD